MYLSVHTCIYIYTYLPKIPPLSFFTASFIQLISDGKAWVCILAFITSAGTKIVDDTAKAAAAQKYGDTASIGPVVKKVCFRYC